MHIQPINNVKFQEAPQVQPVKISDKNTKRVQYFTLGLVAAGSLWMLARTRKTRILDIIAKDRVSAGSKLQSGSLEIEIKNFKNNDKVRSVDELSGISAAKEFVEIYQTLRKNPETMKEHNIEEFSSLLFWGVPGTGKTITAMGIAKKLDADFIQIDKEFYDSMFVSEGSKSLAEIINQIEQHAKSTEKPVVVFMDEIDGTISVDRSYNSKHSEDLLNTLKRGITYLQEKCDNILFIGATNKDPNGLKSDNLSVRLNTAILDRFKYLIEFDLPDSRAIGDTWRKLVKTKSGADKFTPEQNEYISKKFYEFGMSYRDIENIADKLNRGDAVEFCKTGSYNSKRNLIKVLRSDEKIGYDSVKQQNMSQEKIKKMIDDLEKYI